MAPLIVRHGVRRARRMVGMAAVLGLATPVDGVRAAMQRAGPQTEFFVVVNAANPMTEIDRDGLSKIFLKRSTMWSSGKAIQPVDLPIDAASRGAFSKAVLHKSVTAVRAYWQQQIFSGRDVPPAEKPSESDVLDVVKSDVNAIGYVSSSVILPPGVKRITVLGIDG